MYVDPEVVAKAKADDIEALRTDLRGAYQEINHLRTMLAGVMEDVAKLRVHAGMGEP